LRFTCYQFGDSFPKSKSSGVEGVGEAGASLEGDFLQRRLWDIDLDDGKPQHQLLGLDAGDLARNKRKGKMGCAAIKLDMSKAYDRVEWGFLKGMMRRLGFCEQWINLIMECVTTVTYRVKVYGELSEAFAPERGLRQGDPLSPYLFLLCAEGFSELLRNAEESGMVKGLKICHGAPSVSHLLFVDDSLILCRADRGEAQHLQSLLQLYEACSGQVINKEKSAIMFSPNTPSDIRAEMMQALQVQRETMNERYLGLPVFVGRKKSKASCI